MSWAVSPQPRTPFSHWACEVCSDAGGAADTSLAEVVRSEGARHVVATGHRVIFTRGTEETLLPLATAVTREQAGAADGRPLDAGEQAVLDRIERGLR